MINPGPTCYLACSQSQPGCLTDGCPNDTHHQGSAALVPQPAHVVLRALRALLGLLQLLLRLAELGQVQRGDLLGVLDLLLVPEIPAGMSSALREGRARERLQAKLLLLGPKGNMRQQLLPLQSHAGRGGTSFGLKFSVVGPWQTKSNNNLHFYIVDR